MAGLRSTSIRRASCCTHTQNNQILSRPVLYCLHLADRVGVCSKLLVRTRGNCGSRGVGDSRQMVLYNVALWWRCSDWNFKSNTWNMDKVYGELWTHATLLLICVNSRFRKRLRQYECWRRAELAR